MGDLLKMFDGIVCICTKQEEDKWQKSCLPQFKKFGCLHKVIRIDVTPPYETRRKCEYSHYIALKKCQEKKFKLPLILESDFHFISNKKCIIEAELPDSLKLVSDAIGELKEIDWKLFYLGGKPKYYYNKVSPSLLKLSAEQTHAYCVNPKYYDEIINIVEKHLNTFLDWVYSRKSYSNLYDYAYMTKQIVVEQKGKPADNRRARLARKSFRKKIPQRHWS